MLQRAALRQIKTKALKPSINNAIPAVSQSLLQRTAFFASSSSSSSAASSSSSSSSSNSNAAFKHRPYINDPTTFSRTSPAGKIGTLDEEIAMMNAQTQGMAEKDPLSIIHWAKNQFSGRVAMSTSFGLQASVLLHMATRVMPDIPVVWVDTGYLPPETYKYAEELREILDLNLIVVSNTEWTPARMEAIHGKLWESEDPQAHSLYGKMRKVVPLKAGLDSIQPQPLALFSGLRAGQTKARANMEVVGYQHGRFKILPMLKMSDQDVADYMHKNDLPKHPLQAKGYLTVGDWHSSRPAEKGEDARATRFGGKFEECGLHVDEPDKVQAKSSTTSTSPNSQKQEKENTVLDAEATHQTPKHQSQPIKPGLESLSIVKAHQDTGLAIIMVKKRLEDGLMCRKCQDVAEKMSKDGIGELIGHYAIANVIDPTSEGTVLAKHFDVATAPFFLVRTAEEEKKHLPWKPVRSYLQLRKLVQSAQEKVEEAKAKGTIPKKDPKVEAEEHRIKELRAQISLLQAQVQKAEQDLKALQA